MEKEKYIVIRHHYDHETETKVKGKPQIDADGYLRFGRDDFVFNRNTWIWFKKDTE